MMSRRRPFSLLILAASLGFAASAQATPIAINIVPGSQVKVYDGPGNTGGGEFFVDLLGSGASTTPFDFTTFCIEKDEYLSFGTTYNVSTSNTAQLGGVNTNSGDPLDSKTAYLYYKFLSGTLAGYTPGSAADADTLQNLFWNYEQEQNVDLSGNADAVAWNADAVANAGSGNWGVQVLNMKNLDGSVAQDLLVYTGVPEPASMLLLGSGLMGLGFLRRRNRTPASRS